MDEALEKEWRDGVGDRIRRARGGAKLKQRELAAKLKVDKAQISRWERGHFPPTLMQLLHIAKACDVRAERLIAGLIEPSYEQLQLDLDPDARNALHEVAKLLVVRRTPPPARERATPEESV